MYLLKDRRLWAIFSITFIAMMGIASTAPAFPDLVMKLAISPKQMGILVAAFTLPGILFNPIGGVLADRFGRRVVLLPSLLLFGISGAWCYYATTYTEMLVLFFLQGVGAAPLGSLNTTLVGDLFEETERPKAMGYNLSVLNLSTAVFPIVGGVLAGLAWNMPFLTALLALPVAVFCYYIIPAGIKSDASVSAYFKSMKPLFLDKMIFSFFFITLISYMLLFGPIITYIPFLVSQFIGDPFYIGVFLSLMAVVASITSFFIGWLARNFGLKMLMVYGSLICVLAVFGFALSPSLLVLGIFISIYGIGHGMNMPSIYAALATISKNENRGILMAANRMVGMVGQTLGPLVYGSVFIISGMWGVAVLSLLIVIAAIFILFYGMKKG